MFLIDLNACCVGIMSDCSSCSSYVVAGPSSICNVSKLIFDTLTRTNLQVAVVLKLILFTLL